MSTALPLAGAVVILAVVQDVFATVLSPVSGHGVLRTPVSRAVWEGFRAVSGRLPVHRRRRFLTYSGPVIIVVNLATWGALLTTGFALIYQPALGEGIQAASGSTDTSWATAFYYSGFAGTTLGVGDVAASHGVYRLLTVAQAASGFAGITMAITYFLSVYGSLAARNAGAQALHHRTLGTGDGTAFVIGLVDGGDLAAGRERLSWTAEYLRQIGQSHAFYPVLRFFHYTDDEYALPRVLLIALDAATLLRTAVEHEPHGSVLGSRSLDELDAANRDLLDRLAGTPDAATQEGEHDAEREPGWRSHYDEAVTGLRAAGVTVVHDPDAYIRRRASWDHRLRSLADTLAYDWHDIDPAAGQHAPRTA